MGRAFFAMMLSLDGFIADADGRLVLPPPGRELHQHFNDGLRRTAMVVMGRRMWEVMDYWNGSDPDRDEVAEEFAQLWQGTPKAVVSTTLAEAPAGVELIRTDVVDAVSALIDAHDGDIEIAGPTLAASIGGAGLIEEYRLYYLPVVLGAGTPVFPGGFRPALALAGVDLLPDEVVRLSYSPVR